MRWRAFGHCGGTAIFLWLAMAAAAGADGIVWETSLEETRARAHPPQAEAGAGARPLLVYFYTPG